MAFLYVPNGAHMADWTPATEGAGYEMPAILQSLEPFRNDVLILTGLAQDNAHAKGDGGGDHARSLACFLTGVHPRKTDGADIKNGISVDQLAAQKIGKQTRFPSLELGIDRGAQSGNCDSGYSCAYSSNISWASESTPVAKEVNPRLVFERLFGSSLRTGDQAALAQRLERRRSILDYVAEDARGLHGRLGSADRRKLDEYLTSIREIERRLTPHGDSSGTQTVAGNLPTGIPQDNREHIRLMCDMMVLAFQSNLTRIATFMFANEGSNKPYPWLNIPEGHHDLSHHGGDQGKQLKIRQINSYHVEQLAYLLGRMSAVREGDSTLLDHTMLVYGSGISDGDRHNHDDLPIILAGKAGGSIKPGRHVRYAPGTPLCNLYLSLLVRIGVEGVATFGDSQGRLASLEG
jgi:hypothetical protein